MKVKCLSMLAVGFSSVSGEFAEVSLIYAIAGDNHRFSVSVQHD
jgi:hypothetical protein